jgi:hypothetical protein
MKTNNKAEEIFFESARAYAKASILYTPDGLADWNHLFLFQLHLQTIFLFPQLSDKERPLLCRLRYLGDWLEKAKDANRFGLSPRNLRQFQKKVRQSKSECSELKQRWAREGLKKKLTEIQLQTVMERYLS